MTAEIIEEIPAEALKAFLDHAKEEWEQEATEFPTLEEIRDAIREAGESDETTDSDYIHNDYVLEIGKWKFEARGSCYRKDQSICDEEMSESIEVIDMDEEKRQKAKEKAEKQAKDTKIWDDFFEGKTKEEILSELRTRKFPK